MWQSTKTQALLVTTKMAACVQELQNNPTTPSLSNQTGVFLFLAVIEREIIRFENLVNETRILQEETKGLLDKLEKRSRCYVECNPSIRNPCFDD